VRDGSRALARAILDKAPWLWWLEINRLVVGLALQRHWWRRHLCDGCESRFTSDATLSGSNRHLMIRDVVSGEPVNLFQILEGIQVAFQAFQAGSTWLVVAFLVAVILGQRVAL
jgi:hypothetical protein